MNNTKIASAASAVLSAIAEGVDPEGNTVELFEALQANGQFAENEFESAGIDHEQSLQRGVVVIVNPDMSTICSVAADGSIAWVVEPAMAPIAYYRALVNRKGAKFFRTSRLRCASDMAATYRALERGFRGPDGTWDSEGEFTFQVLRVDANRVGEVMSAVALADLIAAADAETAAENAQDVG